MGWKTSSILIQSKIEKCDADILYALGYGKVEKTEAKSYDAAMYPPKKFVYIGRYKGVTIISGDAIAEANFVEEISWREEELIGLYPEGEICSVSLQSTVNYWAFSIIKDGHKIRVKGGSGDSGTYVDKGTPLEQESDLLAKSEISADGSRVYRLKGEEYAEDQVGENFVFQFFCRYTGLPLDQDDQLLSETSFAGYRILPVEYPGQGQFPESWQGEYVYGDGYDASSRGKKMGFTLKLQLAENQLRGVCYDDDKTTGDPASINGVFFDSCIWFLKAYPGTNYTIGYSGLYNYKTGECRGVWNIEGTSRWGEWRIRRMPAVD